MLAEAVSPRCYVVGDFVYHRAGRLHSEDLPLDYKTSAVILYLHQLTTVSDIFACVQKMTGKLHMTNNSLSVYYLPNVLFVANVLA